MARPESFAAESWRIPASELISDSYFEGHQATAALYSALAPGVPTDVRTHLRRVSQLGLKEVWVGQPEREADAFQNHNRWNHSRGAYTVARLWMDQLAKRHVVPATTYSQFGYEWDDLVRLVGTALLLHDYGHAPFSHLIEEALDEINWIPRGATSASWLPSGATRLSRVDSLTSTRLSDPVLLPTWNWLVAESRHAFESAAQARDAVHALITGSFGIGWVQAIVNSAIDADKIDYLRFDSEYLRQTDYPTNSRLQSSSPRQWLDDFLSEQWITQQGILALDGRSAIAAADLWRERVFLYDRFYLAPELRVPERMTLEIVKQFLIRSSMSSVVNADLNRYLQWGNPPTDDIASAIERASQTEVRLPESASEVGISESDPISIQSIAYRTSITIIRSAPEDPRGLEVGLLELMMEHIDRHSRSIDDGYLELLHSCMSILRSLGGQSQIREVAQQCLVREPLMLRSVDFEVARNILRPIAHAYSDEVLIDLVRLPRVLAVPRRERRDFSDQTQVVAAYNVLVPEEPIREWGIGSMARAPLTDDSVTAIERPVARVTVVSPDPERHRRAAFVWDRVRSALLDGGLELQSGAESQ